MLYTENRSIKSLIHSFITHQQSQKQYQITYISYYSSP